MKALLILFAIAGITGTAFAQPAIAGLVGIRPALRCRASSSKRAAPRSSRRTVPRSPMAPGVPHRGACGPAATPSGSRPGLEPRSSGRRRADRIVHRDRRCDARGRTADGTITVDGETARRRRPQRRARGDAERRASSGRFPRLAATTRCSCSSRASSPASTIRSPATATTSFPIHGGRTNEGASCSTG